MFKILSYILIIFLKAIALATATHYTVKNEADVTLAVKNSSHQIHQSYCPDQLMCTQQCSMNDNCMTVTFDKTSNSTPNCHLYDKLIESTETVESINIKLHRKKRKQSILLTDAYKLVS